MKNVKAEVIEIVGRRAPSEPRPEDIVLSGYFSTLTGDDFDQVCLNVRIPRSDLDLLHHGEEVHLSPAHVSLAGSDGLMDTYILDAKVATSEFDPKYFHVAVKLRELGDVGRDFHSSVLFPQKKASVLKF